MTSQSFAFWLTPSQPAQHILAKTIQTLARQTDTEPFEPHVTLFGGTCTPQENIIKIGHQIVADMPAIQLTTQKLAHTDTLFKSLFIAFADHPILSAAAKQISASLQHTTDYQLQPHLSLLYKIMPAAEKRKIVSSLNLNLPFISFDCVQLVFPSSKTNQWTDIAGWQIIKTWPLPQ